MMVITAVSTMIGNIDTGITIIEESTIVVPINGEQPMSGTPYNGTQEVVGSEKQAVLPVVQDATQVVDSVVVINAIEIGRRPDTEEVVEVDLVGIIILLVV